MPPIIKDIKITGLKEFQKFMTTHDKNMKAASAEWAETLAKVGKEVSKALAPVRTGQLKRDIKWWKSDKNQYHFGIPPGSKSEHYAAFPERGTRSPIKGKGGPLVFRGDFPFKGAKHVLPAVSGQRPQRFISTGYKVVDAVALAVGLKIVDSRLRKRVV